MLRYIWRAEKCITVVLSVGRLSERITVTFQTFLVLFRKSQLCNYWLSSDTHTVPVNPDYNRILRQLNICFALRRVEFNRSSSCRTHSTVLNTSHACMPQIIIRNVWHVGYTALWMTSIYLQFYSLHSFPSVCGLNSFSLLHIIFTLIIALHSGGWRHFPVQASLHISILGFQQVLDIFILLLFSNCSCSNGVCGSIYIYNPVIYIYIYIYSRI
jgi:hypothetical protein